MSPGHYHHHPQRMNHRDPHYHLHLNQPQILIQNQHDAHARVAHHIYCCIQALFVIHESMSLAACRGYNASHMLTAPKMRLQVQCT